MRRLAVLLLAVLATGCGQAEGDRPAPALDILRPADDGLQPCSVVYRRLYGSSGYSDLDGMRELRQSGACA